MKALAIDTTSSRLTVGLILDDKEYFHTEEVGSSGHSRLLMQRIDELLSANSMDVSELDTVAAVVGPGSFTGIRIGVATMTAMAFALSIKRIAVTAFELIAYNRDSVDAAVDAGHGNLYVAHCNNGRVESTEFIENGNLNDYVVEPLGDPCATLAAVVRKKAEADDYVAVLEPYYMRRSQAEREKDEV